VTIKDPAWRGLRVDFPSSVLGPDQLNESCDGAVAVAEVEPESPAYEAGLRSSMLITHVGTTPLDTRDDFRREVAGRKGPIELTVVGQAGEHYTITVPETVAPKKK
jgi:S1-C subfamily serine protease